MTSITAIKNGNHYRFEVEGHADSHDTCVMISCLTQTLMGSIRINDGVDVVYEIRKDGYLLMDFLTSDPMAEEDVRCIVIGLIQVQNTYPEGVSITQNIFKVTT